MFKFLNQGAKIMRIGSGIIAIATLAVLAAVITTLALSSFTAEAQGNSGAVANLQLSSTTAGTLTVSWDAASPTPTDYRVDWAKSTEDYKSWKVDEGHVYTAETATTTTITDLSHDTEYKIRMRARYYRGEHEGKSWAGPWATATITVAGEPAEPIQQPPKEDPTQQPTRDDPDPPAGTIETLTTTDDDTGQLLLTWTAPNSDPTDYHVNWGKSTEDYPSDTASDGNDHPTDTTLTMTVLEFDTEYKIRVRARYSDGDHAASPWNGPWTETTAQVHQPLPAAPSFINTAVTEGQVLLSWSNPSDDSITGYQILRGPDAENLVVIEDDTGSSSTSYTDTAPPAGQTHTYGVKARNASGLSPAGTATATVPAAEVEEELVTARHESTDNTLVSNVGQPILSGAGVVSGASAGIDYEQAIRFTTGANPNGYHLTGVQLYLQEVLPGLIPNPMVSLRGDNGGLPGETVIYTLTTSTAITGSWNLVTFATSDQTTLQPNTRYWLHVTASTFPMTTQLAASSNEDAASNVGWRISDGWYGRRDGLAWTEYPNARLRIAIHGHPAPAFLVSNLDSPDEFILFRRGMDIDGAKIAQAFSAANNENGTPAEFDFHGITVLLKLGVTFGSQLADSDILATVHSNNGGQPGDLVYTLAPPAETYTIQSDAHPVTFSAPSGSTLSSGITYWVKFEIGADSTFFTGVTYITFEFATDDNEVQGPTTYNRWSIGHDSLSSPETLSWTADTRSIKISVLGSQRYATLVSNIDQPFLGAEPTGEGGKAAQSFLTPPGPLGQQYRLHRVRINAGSSYPTQATIDLHADNNGTPGDHLVSMIMPGDFAPGDFNHVHLTAIAPRGTLLNPGTRYWIVITNDQTSNLLRVGITASKAQDPASLDFWTIDDFRARKESTEYWGTIRDTIQMELLGSPPFIRTDESDGPDLPGAGHNAHRTGTVVTPGIVSTGHLTPGLDRNHGLYGDYWWLDTKTGHRYRIEVKFGDSQNNDTGGSAWMSFIDPDHDDYPYASGCCEADHNRDDGHTFVHFRRPTDDWNNRYLVHIAAFDKLNHNSNIYNGPYTITMTDITGTEKVATNLYLGTRIESTLPTIDDHIQYAVSFTTGDHPGGYYKLDRVRMQVPDHQGQPDLVLHTDTSGLPGDGICDLLEPNKVQHHRPYAADNALPVPFRAAHCGRDAVLAASTTYWLVLEGDDYETVFTDSNDQQTRGSGWTIGDRAAINLAGSWESLTDNDGTIPVEIWASSTPPPNRHAAGVPLVHGERRVGETLTADITGITDPEGLSDPRFTYSWIRGDGVDEESITGEESETYTLKDDDAGQRIKTLVTFLDNEEGRETAVGPATSLVAPEASRILVSNIKQSGSARTTDNISNGFVSGAQPHGYVIDEIVFERSITTQVSSNDAEFRLYTSTLDNNVRERKPDTRIMTISPPYKTSAQNIFFSPQSRVKLAPSTTYHAVFTTRTDEMIGCFIVSGGSEDSGSLEGFDILDRFYVYPMGSDSGFTDGSSCVFRIKGFELASSNLVQSVDFTSTPAQPGMYATGELMEATATLTQAVAFDGPPPVILLQIGDNERQMEYFTSESTDTSWVFRYTVVADDRDDDGVSINHNALRGYADADLSHYGITNDQTSHVNAAPRVVSQRVSSSPLARLRYGPGEKIQFTVEFSLPVTVVGNPRLEFNIDTPAPQNEFASYLSGSGTKELVFSYTIQEVDDDSNGIEWGANSLRLVDGVDEINGVYNGLDAILDHTALNQLPDHRITQNPRVVSQEVTSDPTHGTDSDTYGAGDAITFQVVFNQAVTVTGGPRLRFGIVASYKYAAYVSGSDTSTLVFSYTILAADADTDGIYIYDNPLDYPNTAIDTIIGTSNNLPAVNSRIGNEGTLPGHKVDGTITN